MKVIIQRVNSASVKVDNEIIGKCAQGLLLLVGYGVNSNVESNKILAKKIINLRIFSDEQGRFDKSILDINGSLLIVPQFTLYADTSKGRRPDFFGALKPKLANDYFNDFLKEINKFNIKYESGKFGADMKVSLENDGPVTIILED
ncbi:UNVERIFIED_CONTAM: hypothetical protein GTU68_000002 [Idotea baltica]|nr:hypothetical protein [Idotea baltica]